MENFKQNKPNYYLNEYRYKLFKNANIIAWAILKEAIYKIRNEMVPCAQKYISNLYQINKLLNTLEHLGKRDYQLVNYCLDLCENEVNIKSDGTQEMYRYYYKDAGIRIFNAVTYKEYLLKSNSKKMLRYLTSEGKKERDKIKKMSHDKFEKLEKDLFSLIENDTTLEDTEDHKITN